MADDDKAKAGDDPWAGLESEQAPDLNDEFSFEVESSPPGPVDEPITAVTAEPPEVQSLLNNGAGDVHEWDEEHHEESSVEESPSPELSVFRSEDDEGSEGAEASAAMIGRSTIDIGDELKDGASAFAMIGQSAIGLGDSGIASASSLGSLVAQQSGLIGGDPFASIGAESDALNPHEPEAGGVSSIGREPSLAWSGDPMDEAAMSGTTFDFMAIAAAASADPARDEAAGDAGEGDPFPMASSADDDSAADAASDASPADVFSFAGVDAEPSPDAEVADEGVEMAATAAVEQPKAGKKPSRPAPPRKKKPNAVRQLAGVVMGGLMAFPIVVGILWWIVGKDALNVAPLVPDSLSFIVPAKLRSGGQVAKPVEEAPTLDDVLGGTSPEPSTPDVATTEPVGELIPEPAIPEPTAPEEMPATDLAVVTPTTGTADEPDTLGDLLNEEPPTPVEPPQPAPVPEPAPLDTAALDAAADKAKAALDAVQSVDDPSDPMLKKLLVDCYRALSGYAQELAMLEQVATDAGRSLATMPAAVTSIDDAIASRPELFESLTRLTRDWMAYSKRSSDGVVAPVTLVSVRRAGPYWRAAVTLGERPLVVLARTEPSASPGETVIVTGLMVEGGVVVATQIQPAKASDPVFDP